jgi:hypothetical protein
LNNKIKSYEEIKKKTEKKREEKKKNIKRTLGNLFGLGEESAHSPPSEKPELVLRFLFPSLTAGPTGQVIFNLRPNNPPETA